MARKKTTEGGERDLIDRNHGGGMETGDATERAEFSEADPPRVVGTDYSNNLEYVAAQEATNHDAAVEDEESAARVAHAPTGSASERDTIKRANFSRLASKRVTGVLERLSVLKNLANPNSYDWTQEQHDKIFNTINEHLAVAKSAFDAAKKAKVRDKSQLRFEV
jgi:hypothetical protein